MKSGLLTSALIGWQDINEYLCAFHNGMCEDRDLFTSSTPNIKITTLGSFDLIPPPHPLKPHLFLFIKLWYDCNLIKCKSLCSHFLSQWQHVKIIFWRFVSKIQRLETTCKRDYLEIIFISKIESVGPFKIISCKTSYWVQLKHVLCACTCDVGGIFGLFFKFKRKCQQKL